MPGMFEMDQMSEEYGYPSRSPQETKPNKWKIYVASSWKNLLQPAIVSVLRNAGHAVYDFRNPVPGNSGFSWGNIAENWEGWTPEQYREAL